MDTRQPSPRAESRTRQRNRERILHAARDLLVERPEASMEEIADAAGVARRTLYGHFQTREALILSLVGFAGDVLLDRLGDISRFDAMPPEEALAAIAVHAWRLGHHMRFLLAIARRSSDGALLRSLEPVSRVTSGILARGQTSGVFASHLPPDVLARVLQTQCMALLEMTTEQGWQGSERVATLAVLLTAGVPAASAAQIAARLAHDGRKEPGCPSD